MSKRITIEELQSYLWNSAVLLRTNIDAGAYKQYIFPLLFFKRICDVYDEETALAIEEYGDDAAEFDADEIHTGRRQRLLGTEPCSSRQLLRTAAVSAAVQTASDVLRL